MVKIIFIIKVIIIIILFRVKMIVTATLVYLVVTTDSNAFLDRRNKQTNYNAKEKKCKTFPEIAYCAVIFSIAVTSKISIIIPPSILLILKILPYLSF
mgnify:CR=1 FL=1